MAIDVKTLSLSVDEYKRYRAEDAMKIKEMGIRLEELTATGKIDASVEISIQAPIKDTVFLHDTVSENCQKVEIKNEYPRYQIVLAEIITKDLDYVTIKKMFDAGIIYAQIGYESASSILLKKINKKKYIFE